MGVTAAEFASLREAMGWPSVSVDVARACLENSCFVGARRDEHGVLLGLVRVVGDGALVFYIADVMVRDEARGQGIGHDLMKQLTDYLGQHAMQGATVAVVPLRGRESFYERHGFVAAPKPVFGDGMLWLEPLRELLSTR